jgi:hypothetical protein
MKEILKYWNDSYYVSALSIVLAIVGLIISIVKRNNANDLKLFKFFFLGYIINLVTILFDLVYGYKPLRSFLFYYPDFLDTILEFAVFFFFIKKIIGSDKIRKALSPLWPMFSSYALIYFLYYIIIHGQIDQHFLQNIFTVQATLLIISCLFYFFDLFKRPPVLDLLILPSFWVVTGLAFFMICTLPFTIFGNYLVKVNNELYVQLFGIFEIFYCLLFIMIIKAFLCIPVTPR